MTLFGIILKILAHFSLTTTDERQQLTVDVKKWEDEATEKSDDKLKQLYWRLHRGVLIRLFLPFLFFFGVRYFKQMIADEAPEFLED